MRATRLTIRVEVVDSKPSPHQIASRHCLGLLSNHWRTVQPSHHFVSLAHWRTNSGPSDPPYCCSDSRWYCGSCPGARCHSWSERRRSRRWRSWQYHHHTGSWYITTQRHLCEVAVYPIWCATWLIGLPPQMEALLTAMLVFTVLMLAAEKHKATFMAPIGIGLVLFVCQLFGTLWTGCGMNPARALGPSVVTGRFPGYRESGLVKLQLQIKAETPSRPRLDLLGRSIDRQSDSHFHLHPLESLPLQRRGYGTGCRLRDYHSQSCSHQPHVECYTRFYTRSETKHAGRWHAT